MSKYALEAFLLKSRSKTYAAATGHSEPLLPNSVQYEYRSGDYCYRDIYYIGNRIFSGLETVFHKDKPVWSMSYFGDFSEMTEEQADGLLRRALLDLWKDVRIYHNVKKDYGKFIYICKGTGTIDKLSGVEEIHVSGARIYDFNYRGGFIG